MFGVVSTVPIPRHPVLENPIQQSQVVLPSFLLRESPSIIRFVPVQNDLNNSCFILVVVVLQELKDTNGEKFLATLPEIRDKMAVARAH